MKAHPRINPAAIDLLARVFNSHRKGLPEWMKNAREAYLRKNVDESHRFVVINYKEGGRSKKATLECIDFVGISGNEIEDRYLEWANPEAAVKGLKTGEAEGGQGNGGKAYLRQMFEKGYFISVCDGKLSVVSFSDEKKHILNFIPDEATGKDFSGDSTALPKIRNYLAEWVAAYKLPAGHNVTLVRGVCPTKPIEQDCLVESIQQFPQARETIRTCKVHFYVNGSFRRELSVLSPAPHPAFPNPIKIPVPTTLPAGHTEVQTARPPEFPQGELVLCVSARPLSGQALLSWNRIDFHGRGVRVIGWKKIEEFALQFPQFGPHLFGNCTLPLLVDPKDNYELQGRVDLNEGPLSEALYAFIAEESNKILGQLAKQVAGHVQTKKRKNLEKLNERLSKWIESKLSSLRGLSETGTGPGTGKPTRESPNQKQHEPPASLAIQRQKIIICQGVSYPLRAVAYDATKRPVPPGKLVWRSSNPPVASAHPDKGILDAKSAGLATVIVSNDTGLTSAATIVQVHEAVEVGINTKSPVRVGTNRRVQLEPVVKTQAGQTLRKDVIVSWKSSDDQIATMSADGWVSGGEVGEAEVVAFAGALESDPMDIIVEKGTAGKPKGGGKGRPLILLSGQHGCPFDGTPVSLQPTDPAVYQRGYKPDYENNVFWINLQHPLAEQLLKQGEQSVQWRTYHFQRLVDVYSIIEMRTTFADSEKLDIDQVLEEIHVKMAELYAKVKDELYNVLYDESLDFSKLGT